MIKKLLQGQGRLWVCGWIAVSVMATAALAAQTPSSRIRTDVNSSFTSQLRGSLHPLAQAQFDSGRVSGNTKFNGMGIVFNRSAQQQADLEALLAAQQNPASPFYHKWLTPDQYAARFGMAPADIDKVQTWLQQQGFSIDSVARSGNAIHFSGTVRQVEQAFQTEMHYFKVRGETHFSPATALTLPTAIAPTVAAVTNLDDFRPHAMHIRSNNVQARSSFTSGQSGKVFFAPGDIKVIYDLNPLLNAAMNGAGQSIAIMGQSSVVTSDIENFQNAAGMTVKDPTMVLVPGSGSSQTFSGDESESDLDLEWSSAIAPGADVFFVYTGSNTSYGVFDSLQYAVDEKIGNIISISYGACEPEISATNANALEAIVSQAASQGQTVLAASGDQGSTACFVSPTATSPSASTQKALAVSYPASSQYVTGVGGTEISQANAAYYTQGQGYWTGETANSDIVTSALKYMPEVVWNDSVAGVNGGSGLSATGGGVSTLYSSKPSWQKGVPGIPSDNARDVPDVSLFSSPAFLPYLYCSSDQSGWSSGQVASCNSGFRDSATQDLTLAGGTSFATPIFAGMVAIINQAKGYTSGQGLLNPALYTLASNSATYAATFHDITSGNNECPSSLGSSYCSGSATSKYVAGTGYDLATGLGSVDLNALAAAWPASASTLLGTTTSLSAATSSPNASTNDVVTITVSEAGAAGTPTGTVSLSIDGGGTPYSNSGTNTSVTLTSNGTATYTANFAAAGVHTIVAQYAGDATHAPSAGSVTITVGGTSSGTGTFTLGGTNVTVAQGSTANSTITVTPKSGYTGTLFLTFTTSNDSALQNLCYDFTSMLNNGDGSVTVTGTAAVTTQLQFDTKASDCVTGASIKTSGFSKNGTHTMRRLGSATKSSRNNGPGPLPFGAALAGIIAAGFLGRYSKKLRALSCVLLLGSIAFALSACGSSVSGNISNPAKGTYTITLTGTDSATASITAQTTFSLTIN
jgi:subtilase family serine protease